MKKTIDPKKCEIDSDFGILICNENDGIKYYNLEGKPLSDNYKKIKKEKMDLIVEKTKKCMLSGECIVDVNVRVFKFDKCPACQSHEKVMNNLIKTFKDNEIPINVSFDDIFDDKKNLKEFKKIGCNATPCVAIRVGNNSLEKVYQGNMQEIGALSDIVGIKNPLYYKLSKKDKPKRLILND